MRRSYHSDDYTKYHRMVLSQVSLRSFCVNQPKTEDFGPSVINWEVEGPEIGYTLYLNEKCIPSMGQTSLRPLYNTLYQLKAKSGTLIKVLATARVNVNLQAWNPLEHHARKNILPLIVQFIDENLNLYFRNVRPISHSSNKPVTKLHVSSDRISFNLQLKTRMKNIPDPTTSISVSFRLSICSNDLIASNPEIKVDTQIPFYLRPFISTNELEYKQKFVEKSVSKLIQAIISMLDSITPIRANLRKLTANSDMNEELKTLAMSAHPSSTKSSDLNATMSQSA